MHEIVGTNPGEKLTLYSIQYLRGLAAIVVLFQHVMIKATQYAGVPEWFRLGVGGVELFFIISGFIMCYTTANRSGKLSSIGPFLLHRLVRILPLYWILSFAALLVFIVAPTKINLGGGETRILDSFLLLPSEGAYLIKNGWTLSYEFFFYFVFALGLLFKAPLGHMITSLLLVLLVVVGIAVPNGGTLLAFATSQLLLDFILGIILYHLFIRFKQIHFLLSLFLIASGVCLLVLINNRLPTPVPFLTVGTACFMVCCGFVFLERFLSQRPNRIGVLLGDASYSLYLIHPFFLAAGGLLFSQLGMFSGSLTILSLSLMGAISVLGGILCFYFLEKPVTHFLKSALFTNRKKNELKQL